MILYYVMILIPVAFDMYNMMHPYDNLFYNINSIYLDVAYYIFIKPVYLLVISLIYILLNKLKYMQGLVYMITIILAEFIIEIVYNKLRYGSYLRGTPAGLYCLPYSIPCIMILLGVGIIFYIREQMYKW